MNIAHEYTSMFTDWVLSLPLMVSYHVCHRPASEMFPDIFNPVNYLSHYFLYSDFTPLPRRIEKQGKKQKMKKSGIESGNEKRGIENEVSKIIEIMESDFMENSCFKNSFTGTEKWKMNRSAEKAEKSRNKGFYY